MGKFGKAFDVAKSGPARSAVAGAAKSSAKGAKARAGSKAAGAAAKGKRVKAKADARIAFSPGKEKAEFAVKSGAGKAKNKAKSAKTRVQGSGPTPGAGPNKVRTVGKGGFGAAKATYGSGTKRVTGFAASAKGKQAGVAIGPKQRKVGYAAAAGTGAAGAGGYTTYKRRTKSGKVVTVRRKRG